MASKQKFLVTVGYSELAVGTLEQATALTKLLSAMQIVKSVRHHPDVVVSPDPQDNVVVSKNFTLVSAERQSHQLTS